MRAGIRTTTDRLVEAASLRDAGDLARAEQLYLAVAMQTPADPEPHHHLGGIYARLGDLARAEVHYRKALALAPHAAGTARVLAVLLLSQGRYPEGFALFEARHDRPELAKPDLPFPEWRGGEVAGRRIVIWPEQGLGDQIQFARFAPVLAAMGAEVTLVCWPALARLFEASLGVRVVAASGTVEFPDPDGWLMAMSLAGYLGVTPETLPTAPYLKAVGPRPKLAPGFKVGLMTRGNPAHRNDANRSLSPAAAERLRRLPAQVIELTPEETGARDLADTAAIVDQLDLVISVDTAVAHLAGAMGKPCWVLLPAEQTDWRWMRERRDSPWYPSVRLYRQRVAGDWRSALEEIEADLPHIPPAR